MPRIIFILLTLSFTVVWNATMSFAQKKTKAQKENFYVHCKCRFFDLDVARHIYKYDDSYYIFDYQWKGARLITYFENEIWHYTSNNHRAKYIILEKIFWMIFRKDIVIDFVKPSYILKPQSTHSEISFHSDSTYFSGEIHRHGDVLIAFYLEETKKKDIYLSRISCIPLFSKKYKKPDLVKSMVETRLRDT